MKNNIQSNLPHSPKRFSQSMIIGFGALLLLLIFIINSIGQNKAASKLSNQNQNADVAKIADPAINQISPKFPDATNTGNEFLVQSTDGGTTWQDISAGLPENVNISHVYTQGNEVFAGTWNGIVYHCYDIESGEWIRENIGGFFDKEAAITGIFAGKSGPYVSVARHGFFRRIPGTGFWQPLGNELKDIVIHDILETCDGSIYVASAAGIFKTKNDGLTWDYVFRSGWVTSLTAANGVMVACGMQGLLCSADGENWECMLSDEGAIYKTSVTEKGFTALRVAAPWSSSNSNANGLTCAGDKRLRTSADGGKSWQVVNGSGLPAKNVYDMEQAGGYLFCSSDEGISRSADGGKSWELIRANGEKGSDKMKRIELISSESTLYALMVNAGC